MARNRIIYQSEALFVGPTTGGTTGDHSELHRVQDISHDMSATRTDIYEFGRLAALDRQIIEAPTVSLDFSYLLTDGQNEADMGMIVDGITEISTDASFLSGILKDDLNGGLEKNYYVVTVPEGEDADDDEANWSSDNYNSRSVVGFGNGVISNYSVNGAVGDFASASVSIEAYNVSFISGQSDTTAWVTGATLPSVDKGTNGLQDGGFELAQPTTGNSNVFALRPGDITMDFKRDGSSTNELSVGGAILPNGDPDGGAANPQSMHLQNFSIEAPLARTSLTRLGSTFPYFKAIDFPQECTVNTSAYLADVSTGSLVNLICDDQRYDVEVLMKVPCAGDVDDDSGATNLKYTIKNAVLVSQNFSASIGDTKTVDLSFTATYGGARDTGNGLFISGTA